jgi:uncharacterized protein YoxC
MNLIDIFLIILILSASSLCIFLILYLKKVSGQVEAVSKDIHRLVENTIPILNNLEEVTKRANIIVTGVEGYWKEIDHSIETLRGKISNSGSWEKFRDVKMQLIELRKKFRAITKGVSAFYRKYKKK